MYNRWRKIWRRETEIGRKKGKTTRRSNHHSSFPKPSSLLILSSCASISFNPTRSLSLPFLHHSLALFSSLSPSRHNPPSIFYLAISSETTPLNPSFAIVLSLYIIHSFHVHPSPLSSLTPFHLSPSIVVVVDYEIRAEDMSFLATRFSAQRDYTKPLSLAWARTSAHTDF